MKKIETEFEGLFILEPKVFYDSRGYFFESFNQKKYEDLGLNYVFVQDNQSFSSYGTLRGLHFQSGVDAQSKLVRVTQGSVTDVVVDIRPYSKTYGKHLKCKLSEENKKMLLIPKGFAHGFVVTSEFATFVYKCDSLYNPKAEVGIKYNDPLLAIDWEVDENKINISTKDLKNILFSQISKSLL
jgi:dTDP-4-dehydrorhamnose 3,5-epimerase